MAYPPAFEVSPGNSPVVLSIPHTGEYVPPNILERFTDQGRQRTDTDWHVHRLYSDLLPHAATVRALFHRFVIDANRHPDGKLLYSDRNESSLCPLYTFDGEPIYQAGDEPGEIEISSRIDQYHRPYHAQIQSALEGPLQGHGIAILYDCHSIRSVIPRLFSGQLPDFNIGTNDGLSCSSSISDTVWKFCSDGDIYSVSLNGVFRGGWTTRHHGRPHTGIHAVQMELSQSTYMLEQPPWTIDEQKVRRLRGVLKTVLHSLEDAAESLVRK
ncbi:MAG: N-formylglutamate deformylase [Gammaproteobacteria bacterium]|nr:N-formylglutamate deformylase [Gammaproteobacteria bacterium]